jgi:hypothetical protein
VRLVFTEKAAILGFDSNHPIHFEPDYASNRNLAKPKTSPHLKLEL